MMPYELESDDYWRHVGEAQKKQWPLGVYCARPMISVLDDDSLTHGFSFTGLAI